MFIDTHAHMDHPKFNKDRQQLLDEVKAAGIEYIVNPAIMFDSNYSMREKLNGFDCIYYAAGIHPNYVPIHDENDQDYIDALSQLIRTDKTVAVGETGFDFARIQRNDYGKADERTVLRQFYWFDTQIYLATIAKKPLILHVRNGNEEAICKSLSIKHQESLDCIDAHKEAIDVLFRNDKIIQSKLQGQKNGVVHCFSGTYENALQYIDLGFYLGIGAAITYESSNELRHIVKEIGLEHILLETDAPYILPQGFEGKRNTPLSIPHIAQIVADIKGLTVEEVETVTTENARSLFNI
ncbi:MAG: TatD family hydrolase [Lachnospiraceae bacterium]